MVVCPRCSIEYDGGEEYCRKCGSFLLSEIEPIWGEVKTRGIRICPKCQAIYKKGNYCKKCGSLLIQITPSKVTAAFASQLLGKKLIKKWSKECKRLLGEKEELELCLSQLEAQRDRISSDVFNPTFLRYQGQLKEFSSLQQEMEAEVELIKKKVTEQIDSLENELRPIPKRLEQFQSLYHLGALTKTDFLREKSEIEKEIKSRKRGLKRNRQILSLLTGQSRRSILLLKLKGNHLRPLILVTTGVIIILMGTGGYFFWGWHSQPNKAIPPTNIVSPSTPLPPHGPDPVVESNEIDEILFLFENIRQANLRKDIDLFMSCYASDFREREKKRLDTLETWKQVKYLDLSFDLKKQTISGHTAYVRLEWLIRVDPKGSGQRQNNRILLESTLKREGGRWKIKEIKTVS